MPAIALSAAPAHFSRAATALVRTVLSAEAQTVREANAAAVQAASGPHSTAQLKAAGHPYARRAPNPAFDAAIVNVQSGRFRAAFRALASRLVSGVVKSSVVNNSPEARFLTGQPTRYMVGRALASRVQRTVQRGRAARIALAVQSAFYSP